MRQQFAHKMIVQFTTFAYPSRRIGQSERVNRAVAVLPLAGQSKQITARHTIELRQHSSIRAACVMIVVYFKPFYYFSNFYL
jgi:hypothetical protein